jgi:hypothetical protein
VGLCHVKTVTHSQICVILVFVCFIVSRLGKVVEMDRLQAGIKKYFGKSVNAISPTEETESVAKEGEVVNPVKAHIKEQLDQINSQPSQTIDVVNSFQILKNHNTCACILAYWAYFYITYVPFEAISGILSLARVVVDQLMLQST